MDDQSCPASPTATSPRSTRLAAETPTPPLRLATNFSSPGLHRTNLSDEIYGALCMDHAGRRVLAAYLLTVLFLQSQFFFFCCLVGSAISDHQHSVNRRNARRRERYIALRDRRSDDIVWGGLIGSEADGAASSDDATADGASSFEDLDVGDHDLPPYYDDLELSDDEDVLAPVAQVLQAPSVQRLTLSAPLEVQLLCPVSHIRRLFRFSQSEMLELVVALELVARSGPSRSLFDGDEMLLMLLARLHYPTREEELARLFCCSVGQ